MIANIALNRHSTFDNIWIIPPFQSKEYEEVNRTINLLEGDIFIDFDVQFNDTNRVHAFITTDQDKWVKWYPLNNTSGQNI